MASNYAYNPAYNHSNASAVNQSNPYGSGDPYYNESTGFINPQKQKQGTSKWIKIGIPVAVVVIAAAVVGAVLGIRSSKNSSSTSSASSKGDQAAGSAQGDLAIFATATASQFMLPIYPSTVRVGSYSRAHPLTHTPLSLRPHRPTPPSSTHPRSVPPMVPSRGPPTPSRPLAPLPHRSAPTVPV